MLMITCHKYMTALTRNNMTRIRYFNQNDEAEINITPMLDVVFIMLIFFIVTTSFIKETGLLIFHNNHIVSEKNNVKSATIKLEANNNHTVNGFPTSLDGIQALLAHLKTENPDIQAQIIASAEIKTGDLVQVIHQIKNNNIVNYTVSSY